jgi:hypothetical protein
MTSSSGSGPRKQSDAVFRAIADPTRNARQFPQSGVFPLVGERQFAARIQNRKNRGRVRRSSPGNPAPKPSLRVKSPVQSKFLGQLRTPNEYQKIQHDSPTARATKVFCMAPSAGIQCKLLARPLLGGMTIYNSCGSWTRANQGGDCGKVKTTKPAVVEYQLRPRLSSRSWSPAKNRW